MESALDVLSRAATMVQDNSNENRLTSKELPTTAWRRERRLRTGDYHRPHHHPSPGFSAEGGRTPAPSSSPPPTAHVQHSSFTSGTVCNTITNMPSSAHLSIMMAAAASIRPLSESMNHSPSPSSPRSCDLADQFHFGQISHSQSLQQINSIQNDDGPLDMSVNNLKQRNSPPPPYREPLPGTQFSSSLARPSVITQAPPKSDVKDSLLVANRENDNRSCESIDEHFRRSLGNDYFSLFSKRCATQSTKTPPPQPHNPQPPAAHVRNSSPTSPLTCRVPTLPLQSALIQSELIPPPAYPVNLPSSHHQQNSQLAHQNQAFVASKANNILSPVILTAQMQIVAGLNSPPLPLVVKPNVLQSPKHSHNLQKSLPIAVTPLTSPKSPAATSDVKLGNITQTQIFNTSGSSASSPIPSHQQSLAKAVTLSHLGTLDNSPSSSPRQTPSVSNAIASNPSCNLPILIRVKAEPGLQHKSNNSTPPASPKSAINQNMYSNSVSNSSNISSPASPKTANFKSATNPSNTTTDVLASVDDHFAKALGDTWKKLQENKEIRK